MEPGCGDGWRVADVMQPRRRNDVFILQSKDPADLCGSLGNAGYVRKAVWQLTSQEILRKLRCSARAGYQHITSVRTPERST